MERRDLLAAAATLGLSPAAASVASLAGPLEFKVLLDIKRFDTPTVSNAIETFNFRPRNQGFMRPEIKCVFPEFSPMVGYAVTGKIRANQPPPPGASYT